MLRVTESGGVNIIYYDIIIDGHVSYMMDCVLGQHADVIHAMYFYHGSRIGFDFEQTTYNVFNVVMAQFVNI